MWLGAHAPDVVEDAERSSQLPEPLDLGFARRSTRPSHDQQLNVSLHGAFELGEALDRKVEPLEPLDPSDEQQRRGILVEAQSVP